MSAWSWYGNNVVVSSPHYARIRIEAQLASQSTGGNYSVINYQVYIDFYGCDAELDGGYAAWNGGVLYNNGGRVYNYAGNFSNHTVTMATGSFTVGHDANGNGSFSMNAHIAIYASGTSTASGSASLPRIALAPTISSVIDDTIKPTSARLGAELSSYGHGTGCNLTMYYKLSTSGTWISLGTQADAAGYNYWTPTGLTPGKTYNFYCNATNNNGDSTNSSTYSFQAQPVSGMLAVSSGLVPT